MDLLISCLHVKRGILMCNYIWLQFEKNPMSLWAHVSETFKQIDKSSCEKNHGSKEYYGI